MCDDEIREGEPLFIGMDFNVGKMAAVAHVLREGQPRAVDELTNGYDTPDMIRRIKERYWQYEGGHFVKTRDIRIYPDASGDSRKSVNASQTDIASVREAGFVVCVNAANPPVKDRINAANAMFCNATGERRYKVNVAKCPTYAEALSNRRGPRMASRTSPLVNRPCQRCGDILQLKNSQWLRNKFASDFRRRRWNSHKNILALNKTACAATWRWTCTRAGGASRSSTSRNC